ncbi:23544_t:CDS:2 [Gigaspora margarita]|uniref:23544_t:CDS:1 n=1 Tax=Gigaspora margarita TaxID=4874 RepID=A0ABN7UTE5_GIGMA|nr:23544_t:CDS:2 [Gigaspora margarita]
MFTWQQIKRVHKIEIKGKTPQWFQKLEQIVLENKITCSIKEVFIQVDKINETQIKPEKRKLSHKRSKKEWEVNKENLSHNSPLGSSIVPTSKILKVKKNKVEDVNFYQTTICRKCKENKESFEYLIACEVDKARWLKKEYSIANQIWSNLDTVVRKRMTIENLYTILTDLRKGFEDGSRRQKSEDKRWIRFKEKIVLVTEELKKWI